MNVLSAAGGGFQPDAEIRRPGPQLHARLPHLLLQPRCAGQPAGHHHAGGGDHGTGAGVTVPYHDPGYLAVIGEQLGCLRSCGYAHSGLLQVRGVRAAEVPDAVRSQMDQRVAAEGQAGVFMAAQRGEVPDRRVVGHGRGELPDDLLDPPQQARLLRREQFCAVGPASGGQGDLPVGEAARATFSFQHVAGPAVAQRRVRADPPLHRLPLLDDQDVRRACLAQPPGAEQPGRTRSDDQHIR